MVVSGAGAEVVSVAGAAVSAGAAAFFAAGFAVLAFAAGFLGWRLGLISISSVKMMRMCDVRLRMGPALPRAVGWKRFKVGP